MHMLKLIYQFTEKIRDKVSKLNEKGQGMVEYAIILAAVAAIAFAALYSGGKDGDLTTSVKNSFNKAGSSITAVQNGDNPKSSSSSSSIDSSSNQQNP